MTITDLKQIGARMAALTAVVFILAVVLGAVWFLLASDESRKLRTSGAGNPSTRVHWSVRDV